ncbi:hypothetical protein HPB49_023837 [Dermacentor silvarum]|uniref:Uncharacterized protein n=1 Tax=Dermacentor silvarum TaxID=543639 RepID=A0ACB8CTE8_DERSI|nr:hypothetical protein HPB49_023837 [Dermacentor silvarum]
MLTCPEAKPGVLNFHVVPYWRLEASDTFENLYENWAKPTLSAVVDELSPNSPRRFSFDQLRRKLLCLSKKTKKKQRASRASLSRAVAAMSRALPVDQAYDQAAFPTTSSEELRSASEHPTNRPCVLLPQSVRVKLEPAMAPRERTFIMVKPDGVQRGLVGEIIARFENRGYKLVALKFMMAGDALLKEHYDDLAGKPFFNGLIKFMQTGPCVPMVWEGANAILTGRDMIGATNPLQAKLGTVRGDYCIQVGRNLIHGSDSVESAKKEIALWFKESELVDWKPQMESLLYE